MIRGYFIQQNAPQSKQLPGIANSAILFDLLIKYPYHFENNKKGFKSLILTNIRHKNQPQSLQ